MSVLFTVDTLSGFMQSSGIQGGLNLNQRVEHVRSSCSGIHSFDVEKTVYGDTWQLSKSIEVVVDIITPDGEDLYVLSILDQRASVLQVKAQLMESEEIFNNQMNR